MKKAVLLKAEGDVLVIDIPDDIPLEYFCKNIGCNTIEIVRAIELPENMAMVVDEEGLLKDQIIFNIVASGFYGALQHGEMIVGNAILTLEEMGPDGAYLTGMDAEAAEKLAEECRKHFDEWKIPILKKLYERWEGE